MKCGKSFEEEKPDVSEILDSRITYIIASNYDEAELAIGETFENYVIRIDATAPYGRDKNGVAHLFPLDGHQDNIAWREGMGYRTDWGGIRKTGIGWKLNPTIFIALFFFLPGWIIIPLLYYLESGSTEIFIQAILDSTVINLPFIIIVFFLTMIIAFGMNGLDELLKPYGKHHNSIKLLFKDELEYLKFSKKFFWDVTNYRWMKLGSIGFFAYCINIIFFILDIDAYRASMVVLIPDWSIWLIVLMNIGIALIIFLLFTFVLAIFYGLFRIGNLGSDRSKLSIAKFGNMITTINEMLAEAQIKKTKLMDTQKRLDISGKTYYEFQRGNRKIGEFLFRFAAFLIMMCVIFGILIWLANILNLVPEELRTNLTIFILAFTIFAIMCFGIFILPQFKLHKFLKQFKLSLIDQYSSLIARLEYLYFEGMIHTDVLPQIDEEWQTRRDLLTDIELIKEMIGEVKSYGTWSYDFPEIMKLIVIGAATGIPLFLTFINV